MKEIMAIIRPKQVGKTKDVLEKLGFPGISAVSVLGRGKQKGIASEISCELPAELTHKSGGMKYVPKRLVSLVVPDADVDLVVKSIIKVNCTGQVGDGRVFVCPVDNAIRVRTNEEGDSAIK
ncbi:nitrogen regulatory protein P-II [Chloroherpeton thalassium ATCC 35110]|uniref:Nitrogen regulatory protein P-II n=1 Tax=Chloroherpeton thalassium (strain ATCC 35110 / GB-78) TaxID=517418 RepID=B3QTT9_CHLT3|nr:P-II family nitrogen regulator [Chloroherpeton thalassium]ACF14287.1 nitrogen regulatory protein P-II [Chloroherpeton thalassium ATCC 35110]